MEANNINQIVNKMDEYRVYPKGYKSGRIGQKEVIAFLQDSFNLSTGEKNIIISTWNYIWGKYGNKGVPKEVFKKELKKAFGITETRPQLEEVRNDISNNKNQDNIEFADNTLNLGESLILDGVLYTKNNSGKIIVGGKEKIKKNIIRQEQQEQEQEQQPQEQQEQQPQEQQPQEQQEQQPQEQQEQQEQQPQEQEEQEEQEEPKVIEEEPKDDISKYELKLGDKRYKDEFNKFKDYCEQNNFDIKEKLIEIHKNMGIEDKKSIFFGPKTVKYLIKNSIIQPIVEEVAEEPEPKEIAEELKAKPKIDTSKYELKLGDKRYKDEFDILKNEIGKDEIIKIQIEMGINKDDLGNFGEKTVKYIYAKYPEYFVNSNKESIKIRALKNKALNEYKINGEKINGQNIKKFIEGELANYNSKTINVDGKIVYPEESYNTYINLSTKSKYYYGKVGNNQPGKIPTISSGLKNIENLSKLKGVEKISNAYLLKNANNKYVLVLFRGGKLAFATYASPGKSTPTTKVVDSRLGIVDITHISSSEKGIKCKNKCTGWIMPYSVAISGTKGEAIHANLEVTGKKASHGCIRIPPYYAKIFSEYQKALSIELTTIDV